MWCVRFLAGCAALCQPAFRSWHQPRRISGQLKQITVTGCSTGAVPHAIGRQIRRWQPRQQVEPVGTSASWASALRVIKLHLILHSHSAQYSRRCSSCATATSSAGAALAILLLTLPIARIRQLPLRRGHHGFSTYFSIRTQTTRALQLEQYVNKQIANQLCQSRA